MPFGKSKESKKDSKKSGYPTASYPTGASYPTAQYPTGQPAQNPYQTQYAAPPQGAVGGWNSPQQAYAQHQQYPGQAPPMNGAPPPYTPTYQPPPPPGSMVAPAYQPPPPSGSTVVVQGGFDAGARFSHGSTSLPPPPPGVMPNTAQMAAAQGHNVMVTQKKGSMWTGGSDGGYCIW